jgi:hypothetical protein
VCAIGHCARKSGQVHAQRAGRRAGVTRRNKQSITERDIATRFFISGFNFKQFFRVQLDKARNGFDFLRIFDMLFVFVIDSPGMNTPGRHL